MRGLGARIGKALSGRAATASPSRTILANGSAMTAARDGDELGGPVPPVTAPQPDDVAVLVGDDLEAVVFKLVDPLRADRHPQGRTGLHGRMKPGGWRRSRARGERINIGAPVTYALLEKSLRQSGARNLQSR